jgi:hypothetical protein
MNNDESYRVIVNNLRALEELNSSEKFLQMLAILTELMLQVAEDQLAGAEYTNEFKHDRMKIRVIIEKK